MEKKAGGDPSHREVYEPSVVMTKALTEVDREAGLERDLSLKAAPRQRPHSKGPIQEHLKTIAGKYICIVK